MHLREWIEKTEGSKIIIAERIKNGNRLLRRLNREQGMPVKGVKCVSLSQIATEFLCAYYAIYEVAEMPTELPQSACAYVMDELLREQKNKEVASVPVKFVPEECFCVKTAQAVLQSINQIRMNRTKTAYDAGTDVKVGQLKSLIYWYEKKLKDLNLYDTPLLLKLAKEKMKQVSCMDPSGNGLIACLPWLGNSNLGTLADYEPTALEQSVLECLAAVQKTYGKKIEKNIEFYGTQTGSVYTFFEAYGIANEVSYVFQRIEKDRLRFGDVNLIYSEDKYVGFIEAAFESRGIPCVFLSGKKASQDDVVQFLLSVLEWARKGFLYETLAHVVENPLMTFKNVIADDEEKEETSPVRSYNHFLKKGIGWGKERYIACVERVENSEKDSQDEKKHTYFNTFLRCMVDVFSNPCDCGEVYRKLLELSKTYLVKTKKKNEILSVLKGELPVLQHAKAETEEECLRLVYEHLKGLGISDSKREDAVSVMKYGKLEVLERQHQFIIGLSAKQLAADAKESPILSDEELEAYVDGTVSLSRNIGAQKRENFEHSLATLENGFIYMGYSNYDTIELKDSSPSVLYLDYYDKYGNGTKESCSYPVQNQAITLKHDKTEEPKAIGEELGDEDSIDYEGHKIKKQMSASALQTLLTCPLRYYYQYAEGLSKREFLKKSDSEWLNPSARGTLFHRTMETYCDEVLGQKPIAQCEPDVAKFNEIFERMTEETLEWLPYVSEAVYRQEKESVREAALTFLRKLYGEWYKDYSDSQNKKEWRILGNELEFSNVVTLNINDPLDYETEVYIDFNGCIDRLDGYVNHKGELCLRVTDYKTGKYGNIENHVKKHKQVQHYVYAMAAMEYFNNNKDRLEALFGTPITKPVIEKVEYVFPYEKTEKKQRFDATPYVEDEKDTVSGVYCLPKEVKEEASRWLQIIEWGAEPKAALKAKVDALEPEEKTELCQYCSYVEQCRCQLGTKL